MKNRMQHTGALALTAAVVTTAFIADATLGGTSSLGASGSKRRVNATVDTTTNIVTAPVVEKKLETTQQSAPEVWVAEPVESVVTEFQTVMESPLRPIIPVFTALTSLDCNGNGTPDSTEISNGSMDWDTDGILDSCEFAMGDLNLNGVVDSQDVSILLGWWGVPNPLFGDLDADNTVGPRDLGILLGRFGVVMY
jgi:hypothetical protein